MGRLSEFGDGVCAWLGVETRIGEVLGWHSNFVHVTKVMGVLSDSRFEAAIGDLTNSVNTVRLRKAGQ